MYSLQEIVGNIIIIAGIMFMFFGVVGIFKFDTFYTRLLATSKTDTVGALTLIIGVAIKHGFSFFTGKIILLAVIMLIFNPLVAHILARSAYLSGHEVEKSLDAEEGV